MAGRTIGRGTWIDKLAAELVEREESLGRAGGLVRAESGLGASGVPHIGSLGDAARAYAVTLALADAGHRSELVAYADDLDGLRKVPDGMPAWLGEHVGRPVSSVPDPDGRCASYGERMGGLLREGLDALGIRYRFVSAREAYRSGAMAAQAHAILSDAGRIGARIDEMTGQSKFRSALPYFPVCAGCGRLYTAAASEYLPAERRVRYACRGADIGGRAVAGCGHEGEADVTGDGGKLAWKVEFAARWQALGIRFEAYGKDIMDSVRVNDWVSDEVLGYPHPHHARYEMFLDKGGRKISKSSGNVLTAQRWLRYGTPRSVLLLMYKRMAGAREVGLEDVPALMDECAGLEGEYFAGPPPAGDARAAMRRGLFEYVHLLDPPAAPSPLPPYRLVAGLAGVYREGRARRVAAKLAEYGMPSSGGRVEELIRLAGSYADEVGGAGGAPAGPVDGPTGRALDALAGALPAGGGPDDIQGEVFRAAREAGARPGDLCRALYSIILGAPRGPRLGPLIADVGPARVAGMIRGRDG